MMQLAERWLVRYRRPALSAQLQTAKGVTASRVKRGPSDLPGIPCPGLVDNGARPGSSYGVNLTHDGYRLEHPWCCRDRTLISRSAEREKYVARYLNLRASLRIQRSARQTRWRTSRRSPVKPECESLACGGDCGAAPSTRSRSPAEPRQ